jgi:hypothetical protein
MRGTTLAELRAQIYRHVKAISEGLVANVLAAFKSVPVQASLPQKQELIVAHRTT